MAEPHDKDSKTEEPTEKKIRDSLEKGRVPFSREAGVFASILGILVAVAFLVGGNALKLQFELATFIDNPGEFSLEQGADALAIMRAAVLGATFMLLPTLMVIMLAGVAASLAQNQPQLAFDRIMPDWSRVSISSGWKRIFGLPGLVEFAKAVGKLAIVSVAGYLALASSPKDFINAINMEPAALPGLMQDLIMRVLTTVAATTAALVAADLAWSRLSWRRDLRMSKQEVKDELKQTEGDPLIKMRLRSLQRDRSRKRMMAAVPRATLVVANPTHYAVAMRYVREEGGAPLVLAKGKDLIALKIRMIAEENGIPVYEDKALARSLHDAVTVDRMIPAEFYKAVAGIILFLAARGKQARGAPA